MKLRASKKLLVAAAMTAILPVGSAAHADVKGGVFSCNATINLAAGTGMTTCIGNATLVGVDPTGDIPDELAEVETVGLSASVAYDETLCPAAATATGSVHVTDDEGTEKLGDIVYVRIGAAAVVVISGESTGAAVGVFIVAAADIGPGLCADSNVDVTLTGVVAFLEGNDD